MSPKCQIWRCWRLKHRKSIKIKEILTILDYVAPDKVKNIFIYEWNDGDLIPIFRVLIFNFAPLMFFCCWFPLLTECSGLLRKKDIRDMRTSTTHMGSSYKINSGTTDSNVSRYCISLQILTQNLMRASNIGNFRGTSGN